MLQSLKRVFAREPDNPQFHVYLIDYITMCELLHVKGDSMYCVCVCV